WPGRNWPPRREDAGKRPHPPAPSPWRWSGGARMTWQRLGALEGGTVGGLIVVEDGERTAIVAVTPAGPFRSEDGRAWHPLSPEPGPALGDAIAASPVFRRDRTLFIAGRTGVFRSTDG